MLVIQSVWDSQNDASEFFNAYIDFVNAKSKGTWDTHYKTGTFQSVEDVRWYTTVAERARLPTELTTRHSVRKTSARSV